MLKKQKQKEKKATPFRDFYIPLYFSTHPVLGAPSTKLSAKFIKSHMLKKKKKESK